jgi:hypothetical protein
MAIKAKKKATKKSGTKADANEAARLRIVKASKVYTGQKKAAKKTTKKKAAKKKKA